MYITSEGAVLTKAHCILKEKNQAHVHVLMKACAQALIVNYITRLVLRKAAFIKILLGKMCVCVYMLLLLVYI